MQFTNDQNLPQEFFNFLAFNGYKPGKRTDISCTKAIDGPLIARLWKEHGKEVIEDVVSRVASTVGSAVHKRFEEANASDQDIICEKRFYQTFDGITLSGQIDSYNVKTKTLADLKTCSVYKVLLGDNDAWERQLNVNRLLMVDAGWTVDHLQIFALMNDWQKAKTRDPDYPRSRAAVIDVPVWPYEQTLEYINERLALHFGDNQQGCTDKERWARPQEFAVMKEGRKSAMRVLHTRALADSWLAAKTKEKEMAYVLERPKKYTRCDDYCSLKRWCPEYTKGESPSTTGVIQ